MIDRSLVRETMLVSLLILAALTPLAVRAAPDGGIPPPPPPPAVQQQIQSILQEQASRTPTQQKIDSNLLYESRRQGGQPMAAGINSRTFRTGVTVRAGGLVEVDIDAEVTETLTGRITALGGKIISSFPKFHTVRADMPIGQIETLAALPEVRFIKPAVPAGVWKSLPPRPQGPLVPAAPRLAPPNPFAVRAAHVRDSLTTLLPQIKAKAAPFVIHPDTGSVDSEGDTTERVALGRATYHTDGTGIKIGVLSDSDRYLSNSQASNDLGTVTVLSGQDGATYDGNGNRTDTGEGTAMMEIVHDLAPGASLYFATAFGGEASFASNIETLRDDGCQIIIDDVFYNDEPPFEDGTIAAAVNNVTGTGVLYFSSAGNAGRVDAGTSTVWEGNFNYSGQLAGLGGSEQVHSFGSDVFDQANISGTDSHGNPLSLPLYLFWANPYGQAGDDYNLFVTDSTGANIVAQSTNVQNGSQNPVENCSIQNGERVFITKHSGNACDIQLNLVSDGEASLQYQTAGVTHGHSSADAAYSIAATPTNAFYPNAFDSSAQTETFSADGPRRMFFDQNGNELNPGSGFLDGDGVSRYKPNMTASDGVNTSVPGFQPFYGTSAAAPHAGAIAALLYSDSRGIGSGYIGFYMELAATDIDIMASGYDVDSGYGIVDAYDALSLIAPFNDDFSEGTSISGASGSTTGANGGASVESGEPLNASRTGSRSVWYTWTSPQTGWYDFNTAGSSFDTTLGVYSGSSVGSTTTLGSNDDSGGTLQSYAPFFAPVGTVCHVSVDGYGGGYGNIDLAWAPIAPLNDNFASAQGVGSGASGTVYGSNNYATKESGEPNHGGSTGGASIWYAWTAPSTGDFNFNTFGSDYDSTIGVYTGSSVSALTTVAEDDDADGVLQSSASFHAVSGTTYYIAVDGYYDSRDDIIEEGAVTLNWQPLAVSSLALNPASVAPGGSSTGTVTLNADASQSGGSVVTLTSDTSGVGVPASATVASGKTATFTVTTNNIAAGKTATLTAAYNSTSQTATLAVSKSATSLSVTNVTGAQGQTVTLTAKLTRTSDGALVTSTPVLFSVNGTTLPATTNGSGVASVSYGIPASLAAGSHTITVTFAGTSGLAASSGTGTLTVTATASPNHVRFYPRSTFPARMVGGQFQGSHDNSAWTTLATVTQTPPANAYSTLPTSADPASFRYLRYLAANGTYGDVAEVEFDSNNVKLTGTGFGTAGSYNNSGNTFSKALDGSTSTYFDAPAPGNGDFVGIDRGASGPNQVRFYPRSGYASRMVGGQFQGSSDNAHWTTMATVTATPAASAYSTLPTSADPATFRYLRYLAPNGSYGNVAEIEFDSHGTKLTGTAFGTAGSYNNDGLTFGKALDGSTSTYFDAPAPGNGDYVGIDRGSSALTYTKLSGTGFGTAGSYNNSGTTFSKALDGSLSTYFDAPAPGNGDYVGLDLGSGHASVVTRIGYCPRSTFPSRMVGGVFQGSNDNSSWTALYTVSSAPSAGVLTQTTSISSGTAYRYLRYLAANGTYGDVAEIEFDTTP